MFNVPFWISVLTVGAGELVAEVVLGVPLAIAIQRRVKK
jgi:uncharacterized membrane protein